MADKIINKVYRDLRYSVSRYSKLHKAIKEDFEFVQGKQWDDKDVDTLRAQGVKALVINKCKPIIKLVTGIERQSKSDFIGFPEGGEDNLVSNIITRLLKNITKISDLQSKLSLQFKNGAIGGISYIEPWIDYSQDLINGILKYKVISGTDIYPDPDHTEYDMSDGKFLIKVTKDLSKEDLELMFPEEEKKIKNIRGGKLDVETLMEVTEHNQGLDYPELMAGKEIEGEFKDSTYDLIDYYYKTLRTAYYVANRENGDIREAPSKEDAQNVADQIENAVVISKKVPVIKLYQVCGDKVFYDDVAWTYPHWSCYPITPFYAEFNTENIGKKELTIQGVVRVIKDLQIEFNKRRTQELRHLNSSANSGFEVEVGQLDEENRAKLAKYGSSPGVVIERAKGTPEIKRITPMPLSQGHVQAAMEHAQDLKEASGVNPDLLATDSKSQSGRAILLKQKQGLVMIQEMIDNFAITKKILGRFMLSQLGELYTVDTAMKVLGDEFIKDAFEVPVTSVLARGMEKLHKNQQPTELEEGVMLQYPDNSANNPVVDDNGNMEMMIDFDQAAQVIQKVLTDSEIGKYDVSVGEGPYSETTRLSNFSALTDLAQQGVQIPPTTLIEASLIPENEKKKILKQMEAAGQAQAQAQQAAQELEKAKLQMEDKHHSEEMSIEQQEVEVKQFLARVKAYEAGKKEEKVNESSK